MIKNSRGTRADSRPPVYPEVVGDGSGRRAAASPRRLGAARTAQRPCPPVGRRRGCRSATTLHQQLRDAPAVPCPDSRPTLLRSDPPEVGVGREVREQEGHGFPRPRQYQIRGNFQQWLQHKSTQVRPRMRQHQVRPVADFIPPSN